jgi:hypothetical protein
MEQPASCHTAGLLLQHTYERMLLLQTTTCIRCMHPWWCKQANSLTEPNLQASSWCNKLSQDILLIKYIILYISDCIHLHYFVFMYVEEDHDFAHPKPPAFTRLTCSDYDHDSAYSSKLSSDRLRTPTMSVRASNQDVRALQQAVRAAWRAAQLTPTTCRIDHRKERSYNNHHYYHHDWLESSRARQFHRHRPVFCLKISTLPIFVFNTISSNHSNVLTWRSLSINIL